MRHSLITYLIGVGLVTAACSGSQKKPIARVGTRYLYLADITQTINERNPLQDSALFVKKLVNDWIRQQVLIEQAEQKLNSQQKNKQKQVEDLRNSLLIYEYQRLLVGEQLDTTVTEEQVSAYFNKNKSDFELKENLVRLKYVKVAATSKKLAIFRTLIRSGNNTDMARLDQACKTGAANFFLNDRVWLNLEDVIKEVPLKIDNAEDFLKNNTYFETKDQEFIYLVNISGYRIRGSESAPELEYGRIKEMILNARKVKLIREMEQNVLKEAELNGNVEVY